MWPSPWCQLQRKHKGGKRSHYQLRVTEEQSLPGRGRCQHNSASGCCGQVQSTGIQFQNHPVYVSWSEAQTEPAWQKYNSSTCLVAQKSGKNFGYFSFNWHKPESILDQSPSATQLSLAPRLWPHKQVPVPYQKGMGQGTQWQDRRPHLQVLNHSRSPPPGREWCATAPGPSRMYSPKNPVGLREGEEQGGLHLSWAPWMRCQGCTAKLSLNPPLMRYYWHITYAVLKCTIWFDAYILWNVYHI